MPSSRREHAPSAPGHFPVVGIGASAGGLRAIQRFFDNVPGDTGMSFVVITHLDAEHKSQMAELVQSHTTMRVSQPSRSIKLEPNHVYIIPPNKDLSLTDRHIQASARSTTNRTRAPIDLFFRTLAETHHSDAVAIILSGTGSDGSKGISAVRELGGLTMAQAPEDAEFDEMPQNAIATGHVDLVLPVAQLAAETVRLNRAQRLHLHVDGEEVDEASEIVIGKILAQVRAKTGHDFSGYRRATIMRRIERRIHSTQSQNLSDYLRLLTIRAEEAQELFNDLLITVTSFFRDPEAFEALRHEIVPRIFAGVNPADGVRVWVAGCATGEEAYSLAIVLSEYAEKLENPPHIQIFATDVHEKVFAFAREGLYPLSIASDVSRERLDRFFTREPGGYRVKQEIREKVLFANHNLLRDPPFMRIDLVTCRNLLIYLAKDSKRRVASVFHFALRPGGYLLLGTSEATDDTSKLFVVVDKKQRIFRALLGPSRVPRPVPAQPDRWGEQKAAAAEADGPASIPNAWTLHQQLLEAYAAPSLLVNGDGIVIHLSGHVGAYLQRGGGVPSNRLLDMLPSSVRPRFRVLLSRAFSEGRLAEADGLPFEVHGKRRLVDILVRPIDGGRTTEKAALVLFEERPPSTRQRKPATRKDVARSPRTARTSMRQAERELSDLRTALLKTIEEHEAIVEEARASNEELQSINEEQRATAEELETSKEELQSVNEELRTINQEFRTQNEQLLQTNADLENLIDSTDIGTIFLDRELRVRRYTPTVAAVFNFVASDRGRVVSDVTHRLRYPELMTDLQHALRSLTRIEHEVITDDGRWFLVRITPYRSSDNRTSGVVVTLSDTTDRKRSEIESELLLREARKTSVDKTNFISVMSHELRTPLNAIVGYAGIMNAGAVGAVSTAQSKHLDRISANAMHLAHLLDDTLEAARLEAGAATVRRDSVDLSLLVREVSEALAPLAVKQGLALVVEIPDEMTSVTDATKIRQILYNLVANAVRYTDKGTIAIKAELTRARLMISVTDTGIGIAPENHELIFDRFWQVDQSTTRTRGGAGLGLMVSRGLARQLGGDITVTSELAKGSTFVLSLPVEPSGS